VKKEHPYCYEPPATRTLLTFFNVIETVTGIALLIGAGFALYFLMFCVRVAIAP